MRFRYSYRKMDKLFANSKDPDQRPHSVASDLGRQFTNYLLGVSRLQWIKVRTVNLSIICIRIST